MLHGLLYLLAAYALMCTLIVLFQRKLMYFPDKEIHSPEHYGLQGVQDVRIASQDGTQIQLWVKAAPAGQPTLLYFHGNASNLASRTEKFQALLQEGLGLVALSYRGFGASDGSPHEQGLYRDARAAIMYARDVLGLPANRLIYFGESLGSGMAVQMAMEYPPALLVLEAAYTSVATRSAELYPYVPGARHLVLDRYESLKKIKQIHVPLLMLHGGKDTTIPLRHGEALFAAAHEPKRFVLYPEVNHADYTPVQIVAPVREAIAAYISA